MGCQRLPVPPHASVHAKGSSAAGPDCVYGEERLFICLLSIFLDAAYYAWYAYTMKRRELCGCGWITE